MTRSFLFPCFLTTTLFASRTLLQGDSSRLYILIAYPYFLRIYRYVVDMKRNITFHTCPIPSQFYPITSVYY